MSGDTTYQALKRLSYLPERSDDKNGSVIAGQEYDDVYFIGGNIANVVLTGVTINGVSTSPNKRVITAGNVTALVTDFMIVIRKVTGSATSVTLPASPATNQFLVIKDGKGDSATNNITIIGNGHNIDGAPTLIIGSPYGWNWLFYDGTQWDITG